MQFLSFLLWFIANKDNKHKYIWGFEEPEIAYEFQRQFRMSDIFTNVFSNNAQIFITTHSPAFINFNTNEQKGIYQYRVYKIEDLSHNSRKLSVIRNLDKYIGTTLFDKPDDQKESLYQDLWGVNFQRLANSLGNILEKSPNFIDLKNNYQALEGELSKIRAEIEAKHAELERLKIAEKDNYPNKIFICEDKRGIPIWTHFLMSLQYKICI